MNASSTTNAMPGDREESSREIAKTGRSSPTAPCTSTALPTAVPAAPCDFSIGKRVPSAVELSATPTAT